MEPWFAILSTLILCVQFSARLEPTLSTIPLCCTTARVESGAFGHTAIHLPGLTALVRIIERIECITGDLAHAL